MKQGGSFTSIAVIEKLADCFDTEIYNLFNFSHLKEKETLIPALVKKINNASEKELQLIAKIIGSVI